MTAAVLGLAASYLVLAVLLLSLNLRSAWRWPVKAWAIMVTLGFLIGGFVALQSMLGWPTEAAPPPHFQLYAALVHEPDRLYSSKGAIYLWLSPPSADGEPGGPPRAYALPYSRALHEQVARAQERLQQGRPVEGTTGQRPDEYRLGSRSLQVELFEAPPVALPPKTSGAG
jgi:hypothetical protein